ncbi:methyl-accepting chemotaxis protein [Herbaspirillum sp. GCM10030257]|uniref:methyl-accepting chemotaxis protein n=1 Tax=Herbaspirillum sp. GCM10030257 TaxID=3273393 RepID=UPI003613DB69
MFLKFKIGARLGLGFGFVLILTAIMSVAGVWRLNAAEAATDRLVEASEKQVLAEEWLRGIANNAIRTSAIGKVAGEDDVKLLEKQMAEQSAEISALQKKIEPLATSPEEKQLMSKVAETRALYRDIRQQVMKLKADEQAPQAKELSDSKMLPAMTAYVAAVQAFRDQQNTRFDQIHEELDAIYTASRILLIVLGVLSLVIGAFFAAILSRGITKPLSEAVQLARSVAQGDLTVRLEARSHDETGELVRALGEMRDSLLRTVQEIRSGTSAMTVASGEIAAGNLDLSTRTEQQASSLEETASAMEQLTSAVRNNTDNARQADHLAVSASAIASKGGVAVRDVVGKMEAINASSRKIVDIIAVIDGIAFQTNILALNAAVEAARAGEQGRGFAVVASEVRQLAQRSAAAAKDIKALITESAEDVQAGTRMVSDAGTTMAEIVNGVQRVADIMKEILAASEEQSSGIEEVNRAITQMDQVTQQNAALVEEAAAAADSMQNQATKLAEMVSFFKL